MNHTIIIEKIIHGGLGLGRLESGIVILVPFVLPGEEVVVQEKKKHRGYIQAELVKILRPSPDRVAPPCPWFTQCGGCDLQHMNLPAQHTVKENVISESLTRAGVKWNEQLVNSIISSPDSFHYRYRIRLKVSSNGTIGFHRSGSNEIIEIGKCLIASDLLNKALEIIRSSGLVKEIAPDVKEIELLQSPSDKLISSIFHITNDVVHSFDKLTNLLTSDVFTAILIKSGRKTEVVTSTTEDYLLRQNFDASICSHSYNLQWTPGSFSQVNADLNERLVNLVCRLTGNIKGMELLDLYCGTGNFSIPLALKGASVTGIEVNQEAIIQAKQNALKLGLNNVRFVDRDVHKWIRRAGKHSKEYNVIVLDPPRQGMGKNITHLASLSPSKIIYISCDPATLARDIALLSGLGYQLSEVTPLDMFPQTHHVECVALLEKN